MTAELASREDLNALIKDALGSGADVTDGVVLKAREDYLVVRLGLGEGAPDVVVKLAGPRAESAAGMAGGFDRTAALHRLAARETGLPAGEVLAVDVSCQRWPWRYLIRTHLPGETWADLSPRLDPEGRSLALGEIGRAAARLHGIHFPAFGPLGPDAAVMDEGAFDAALAAHARRIIRTPQLQALFLEALAARADLFRGLGPPCLCHEDLHGANLLFQPQEGRWRLAGILDFDKAWAGFHESDLARMAFWTGMTGASFWTAYEAEAPLAPDFEDRKALYQLLWCLEVAWDTPKHRADTASLCGVLGFPAPAREG
jgi:Ser/Thr protein kinase RdoA (MazF antagonist)